MVKLLPQIKSHLPRQLRITSSDAELLHLLELMHSEDSSILPASFAELDPPARIVLASRRYLKDLGQC